jgi:hypothetical protein
MFMMSSLPANPGVARVQIPSAPLGSKQQKIAVLFAEK